MLGDQLCFGDITSLSIFSNHSTKKLILDKYDRLHVIVKNQGPQIINDFKLKIVFPNYGPYISFSHPGSRDPNYGFISTAKVEPGDHLIMYRSKEKLFPDDAVDAGRDIRGAYYINDEAYKNINRISTHRELLLNWTLWADNMTPKQDSIPFNDLYCF